MPIKSLTNLLADFMGTRNGVLPSLQTFPVNADQLARELELDERAERNGKNDLPLSNAPFQASVTGALPCGSSGKLADMKRQSSAESARRIVAIRSANFLSEPCCQTSS
jgi:hypothetical protein